MWQGRRVSHECSSEDRRATTDARPWRVPIGFVQRRQRCRVQLILSAELASVSGRQVCARPVQITTDKRWQMELDNGLLLILGEVPTDFEGRFNEWYDNDHVPARLFVPGIVTARRYKQVSEDITSHAVTYLASYELANLDVLDSDEYKALSTGVSSDLEVEVRRVAKFDRRVYRAVATPDFAKAHDVTICGPYLLCVWEGGKTGQSTAVDSQPQGVLRTRRYRLESGQGAEQLAIHDIESRDAVDEIVENESFDVVKNNGEDSGAELRLFHLHRRFEHATPPTSTINA
jgi:hypothetical protein